MNLTRAVWLFALVFLCSTLSDGANIGVVGEPINGGYTAVILNDFLPSDLYALQFDLAFNPHLLRLNSVTEGPFLPMFGSTFFEPGTIDNTAGTVTFVADSLIGAVPGGTTTCTNCGVTVAGLNFTPLRNGISPMTFSNVLLLDSSLNSIPITPNNGNVTVVTPEPATALPVLAAFVLIGAMVRRARRWQSSFEHFSRFRLDRELALTEGHAVMLRKRWHGKRDGLIQRFRLYFSVASWFSHLERQPLLQVEPRSRDVQSVAGAERALS